MLDRRHVLAGGCACLAWPALAASSAMLVPGYAPQARDEQGLWMVMEEAERELKRSSFVMRDLALNAYIKDILCKLAGDHCADVRVYVMRTPYFNASMAPNGMMQVWSGLFLRTRNEAQLAAVLAHELGHYLRQHSLRSFRDARSKTSVMSFLGLGLAVAGGYYAATAAQLAMVASLFGFSREMEREADAGSVPMLARAGYDPLEASRIWQQLLAERDAAAAARGRKARGEPLLFATHPTSRERLAELEASARALPEASKLPNHRERYLAALKPHWLSLLDDQIKLNDFGGSNFLIEALTEDGWTPALLYARGELYRQRGATGDLETAIEAYRRAIALPDAPAEAQRGLGYALIKAGQNEAGKAALRAYLTAKPDAADKAMIAFMAQ